MIDLKKYREEQGLTPSQFAKICGIPKQNISEYELGKRKISLDKKIKMLEKLGYVVTIEINQTVTDLLL